jgi:hypothetical protein
MAKLLYLQKISKIKGREIRERERERKSLRE